MTNYNKTLLIITLVLLGLTGVIFVMKLSFYNWALWIVPPFFYLLTIIVIRFVLRKLDDKFLPMAITQASVIKLLLSLVFLLFFKIFLDKGEWVNFIIFSAVNYLVYTAFEVNYLLSSLR